MTPKTSVRSSPFIDFQELKQNVSMETAVCLLGLQPKKLGEQLRGPCPACNKGGDRTLVITPSKQAFYCFAAGEGGDVIALVAHIRQCPMKEAAGFLAEAAGLTSPPASKAETPATVPATVPENKKAGLNPLTYLQPEHPSVQALGISSETARAFGAGYAPKGIMRGRLAIPIHDAHGTLIAYCGRSVSGEDPTYIFPTGFDPAAHIFNAHRITEGTLTLVREPLEVLKASQAGIENAVAFLTKTASSQQLQWLADLMNARDINALETC